MAHLYLLARVLAVLSLSAILAHAGYYIDNTNETIQYSGAFWNWEFAGAYLNIRKLYNGTCTRSSCVTSDNCHMTITFTGTGITLYAAMIWSFAFRVTIDAGAPQTHSYDGVPGCCTAAVGPVYNFTLFNVQSLPYGDHILDITLLDTGFGLRPFNDSSDTTSSLMFDYAAVNDGTTPRPTSGSAHSHSNVKYAVGGAVAGVVLISATVAIIIYLRRRSLRQNSPEMNVEPKIPISDNETHTVPEVPRYGSPGSLTTVASSPQATVFQPQPQEGRFYHLSPPPSGMPVSSLPEPMPPMQSRYGGLVA